MKTFSIPYYTSSLELHVDEKNLKAELSSRTDTYDAGKSEAELVRDALANPIGTPRLSELARGKDRIVLVTSDHTRAVPSKLTLPILLEEIRAGNPDKAIARPYSTMGVLEHNLIHEDMVYAARAVNVQFIMNVVLNAEKKVIAAFAGDLEEAHAKGVEFVRSLAQCPSYLNDSYLHVVTNFSGMDIKTSLKTWSIGSALVPAFGSCIFIILPFFIH